MLRLEHMTVFAKFKYARGRAALRVHLWDIFHDANINTASFKDMFKAIEDSL